MGCSCRLGRVVVVDATDPVGFLGCWSVTFSIELCSASLKSRWGAVGDPLFFVRVSQGGEKRSSNYNVNTRQRWQQHQQAAPAEAAAAAAAALWEESCFLFYLLRIILPLLQPVLSINADDAAAAAAASAVPVLGAKRRELLCLVCAAQPCFIADGSGIPCVSSATNPIMYRQDGMNR